MASSTTPKLIIPDEKTTNEINNNSSSSTSMQSSTSAGGGGGTTTTKKLTKILSVQSSFDRHHSLHPVAKRFSIDADPSSVILNSPITNLSNNPLQQPSTIDGDESSTNYHKDRSPSRSPSLKKSDSFLEIPYEKGEIVDLIKLADDPNAAAHVTDDGQEVLIEHGVVP